MKKYLNDKNYVIEIILSERIKTIFSGKRFNDTMDVIVEVRREDGGGAVFHDNWNETYKTINDFKKENGLLGIKNVFIWRMK